MKIGFILLLSALFVVSSNATDIPLSSASLSANTVTYSPQVCQFSLTSYTGTISNGGTDRFQVGLSCPQENDVRATVVLFIDKEYVASKVVTIKAGKDYSEPLYIQVGASYNGKRYRLVVE